MKLISQQRLKTYTGVLNQKRQQVFEKLGAFSRQGFLAGGTALALQIGNRFSYDFDFFCKKPITHGFRAKIKKTLPVKQVAVNTGDEFTFLTPDDIKITFLYYPFTFRRALVFPAKGPGLLSVNDIAAAKSYALNRRASYRDYVDLYCILKHGYAKLPEILGNAGKVYGSMFSEKLFLAQLTYLGDIPVSERKSIAFLDSHEPHGFPEIKSYFDHIVKTYRKRLLSS